MSEQGLPMGPQALSPAGGNELAPQGAPAGSPEDGLLGWLQAAHDQTASRFAKLQEADARLRAVRMAMDGLVKLGDTVDQEDVVKAAGELVKAGLGAAPIASMLADMPEQGEALQAWIAQQDQQVRAREQQLSVVTGLARHQMGVSALRVLTGHAIAGQAGAGPAAGPSAGVPGPVSGQGDNVSTAPAGGNALAPSNGGPNGA